MPPSSPRDQARADATRSCDMPMKKGRLGRVGLAGRTRRIGVLVVLGACALASSPVHAQQAVPEVAARVGDRVVTVQELDQAWRQFDGPGKAAADQAIYDGRKAALDRLIATTLIQ